MNVGPKQPKGGEEAVVAVIAPLMTTAQVARLLAVSRRTICLWAVCGHLRGIKVGRQWRFRQESVHRYLGNVRSSAKTLS